MMDREELHTLSLQELRSLAEQRGLDQAAHLPRSQLLARLGAGLRPHRGLGQRVADLLGWIDQVIWHTVARVRRRREQRVAMAAGPAGGSRGHGAGEVVYDRPGGPGTDASSPGGVRGPESAVGSMDLPHATVERPARPRLAPSGTGPQSEPFGMLDLEELPETYGVDEVEVLYKDPFWAFVYWEVTEAGLAAARGQLGPAADSARLVLRCFTIQTESGIPVREIRDLPLAWNHGRRYIEIPRPGSVLRVAVGLLSREGYFAPIAHSLPLRLPPPQPAPRDGRVEWLHVQPLRGRGEQRERLTVLGLARGYRERALRWRVAGMEEGGAVAEQTYSALPHGSLTSPRRGH
ncbi:MAG: DUF4912 domain-containing protein [Myxococcales bacterium]|nr:DUF4912 domain-containing protein [Myxococcota bacterium]MDW8280430.1 DUF4912 domain-containing protein [Myxococcales bacterium]